MTIKLVDAYDFREEIKALFTEYTRMLIAEDGAFAEYLAIQNYDEETDHLREKYGRPDGRLYLAYADDKPAGCIGLRRIDDQHCEMKRLFVKPAFRGSRIGEMLVKRIITDAKEIGYSAMLLDTLPFLVNAVHLYRKYGFYEIESYNNSPMDTSVYMRLDL